MTRVSVDLVCAGGVPLAFRRIAESHGLAGVRPWARGEAGELAVVVQTSVGPRTVSLACASPDEPGAVVTCSVAPSDGEPPAPDEVVRLARRMLGLEADLSAFHAVAARDPDLAWVTGAGAGAMARGATAFEDVIRTILTTNCAWGMTVRMCEALVELCGEPVPGRAEERAFPTPGAIVDAGAGALREHVRAGYRADSIVEVARRVEAGCLDLEALAGVQSDAELERGLRELPGIGPYAAAHAMMLLGRPALPIIDSWTRPRFARVTGRADVTDADIRRHVAAYGRHAGLALWLLLTREWFEA